MNNFIINQGTINGSIQQTSGRREEKPMHEREEGGRAQKVFHYDFALSYAGEQERYVSRVARILEQEGWRVFFAPKREEGFLGKDMVAEFYRIYRYESMFVAAFVSKEYLAKEYTMHEARTALLREQDEKRNCLIPISFDGARLEEMNPDIHFLDADRLGEVEVADKLCKLIREYKKWN